MCWEIRLISEKLAHVFFLAVNCNFLVGVMNWTLQHVNPNFPLELPIQLYTYYCLLKMKLNNSYKKKAEFVFRSHNPISLNLDFSCIYTTKIFSKSISCLSVRHYHIPVMYLIKYIDNLFILAHVINIIHL